MRVINKIIVHHSAGSASETFEMVNQLHKAKNWGTKTKPIYAKKSSLGYYAQYHYFIDLQGKVHQARNEEETGWHSGNSKMNNESIAVCLSGNFNINLPKDNQVDVLKKLLSDLLKKYNLKPEDIIPHKGVIKTECYGNKLSMTWASDLIKPMQLRCPIQKNFLFNGKTCILHQMFGELSNPEWGIHTGIDINTLGEDKYRRDDKGWIREERDLFEKNGRIQIMAAHDGELTAELNPDTKQERGWGLYVTSGEYRTLYWHIETPWNSMEMFNGQIKGLTKTNVVAGQIIAIAGDNGRSKGAHLHFELQKLINGVWTPIDPIPYFIDREILWQDYKMTSSRWYYQGKEISKFEADKIKKTLLPVI